VQNLFEKLREARTIQVSIEARFITVNTGFLSQIGVDLDFYFNIGSEVGGPSGGSATTTDPFTGAQVPLRNPSSWTQAGYNPDAWSNRVSPVNLNQASTVFANVFNQSTNVPNGIGTLITAPAMSIAGTFLDDLQVDFLIQATQAHSSTRTLTAPRITLSNGQRAYVSVATQQAYIAGVEPVVSENTSGLQPVINYAPTGTVLDVDATVSHDRRYVTITLRPQVTSLNGAIREVPVVSGDSIAFVGLPNLTVQQLETTVSVPDGGTLLIGGQKLSGEIEREMGVPVISKLPVINRAFTNKGKLRDESTLLILVKPTIIIQDEAEKDPRLRKEIPAVEKGLSHTY
jgi:general secretion pathway protein D